MFRDGPREWRTVGNSRDGHVSGEQLGMAGWPREWRTVAEGKDYTCRRSRVQRPEIGLVGAI